MVGSFYKKGRFHPRLEEYGMVIVDECQHVASDTLTAVMSRIKAKYIFGVTATPMRSDGLEKINYLMLGPIRYSYTAKERAEKQNIRRYVYPRFTRSVAPRGSNEKMHPNEAYEIIRNDNIRDDQIIRDVISCVAIGKTPVILSRYRDHLEKLYKRLEKCADHVFLLMGGNSKKEHRRIREAMEDVPEGETVILVATGKFIGEGFDYPGKSEIIVYDYVDSHIPIFDKMNSKRLRAYKQIGYEVTGEENPDKHKANAIFDSGNYLETYERDLKGAESSIIISSPAISGTKVGAVIRNLRDRQEAGVKITVVTWYPDSYGYGKADYWMELHEEMRRAGFYMQLVD